MKYISLGDKNGFENLIGVELIIIGKDKETIEKDFNDFKYFYNKYPKDNFEILITNEYDFLGHRKVIIPIYKGRDNIENISAVDLNLFFGPPQFVPLNKISDYELVVQNVKPDSILLKPPIKN